MLFFSQKIFHESGKSLLEKYVLTQKTQISKFFSKKISPKKTAKK
jgi:hypothetical protein